MSETKIAAQAALPEMIRFPGGSIDPRSIRIVRVFKSADGTIKCAVTADVAGVCREIYITCESMDVANQWCEVLSTR